MVTDIKAYVEGLKAKQLTAEDLAQENAGKQRAKAGHSWYDAAIRGGLKGTMRTLFVDMHKAGYAGSVATTGAHVEEGKADDGYEMVYLS